VAVAFHRLRTTQNEARGTRFTSRRGGAATLSRMRQPNSRQQPCRLGSSNACGLERVVRMCSCSMPGWKTSTSVTWSPTDPWPAHPRVARRWLAAGFRSSSDASCRGEPDLEHPRPSAYLPPPFLEWQHSAQGRFNGVVYLVTLGRPQEPRNVALVPGHDACQASPKTTRNGVLRRAGKEADQVEHCWIEHCCRCRRPPIDAARTTHLPSPYGFRSGRWRTLARRR
jgi:hypothetical protein